MILHMSRGFVLGVLSTVFVAGAAAGYLFRGSPGPKPADGPTLASTRDLLDAATAAPKGAPVAAKPAPARPTASIRPVPTPGGFYRLGDRETLSDVAKRAYGGTKRTSELVTANPGLDPKRLQPGALIYVPVGTEPTPLPVEPPKGAPAMATSAPPQKPPAPPAGPVFAKSK